MFVDKLNIQQSLKSYDVLDQELTCSQFANEVSVLGPSEYINIAHVKKNTSHRP